VVSYNEFLCQASTLEGSRHQQCSIPRLKGSKQLLGFLVYSLCAWALAAKQCYSNWLYLGLQDLLITRALLIQAPDDLQQLDTRDGRSRLQHGQQARHEVACCESHSKLGGAGKHAAQGVQELRGEGRIDGLHKEREREREREREHTTD